MQKTAEKSCPKLYFGYLIEPSKFNKLSRRLDIRLTADRLCFKKIIQKRTLTKSHSFQGSTRCTPDQQSSCLILITQLPLLRTTSES